MLKFDSDEQTPPGCEDPLLVRSEWKTTHWGKIQVCPNLVISDTLAKANRHPDPSLEVDLCWNVSGRSWAPLLLLESASGRKPCCHGCHLEPHASESPGQKCNLIRCLLLLVHRMLQNSGAVWYVTMNDLANSFIFTFHLNFLFFPVPYLISPMNLSGHFKLKKRAY